ncbi:FMN-dependent NADH-azoreductase [Cellulomonas sp. McL0617]|uniref:FMN-dependent NADH-azoreductase n=1 Tax=Cellulomonas sp. McL0617 TaxID=3415675 RepID=UPI003CEA4ECE
MLLLHIIASPRHGESNTLKASEAFIAGLRESHPDVAVEVIDLYDHDLPAMEGENIEAKYDLLVGRPIDPEHAEAWAHVESLIAHFRSADAYLLTVPMWNLSIPYALKYYIDCIVQPGYTFRYNALGLPEPMVLGKKMVIVSTRGSDYSAGGPMHAYDFMEPYLRAIFGFIGITDIELVCGQPMHGTPAQRELALVGAIERARELAAGPEWAAVTADRVETMAASSQQR